MHHYEAAALLWILFGQMEPATFIEIIQLSLLLAMQHAFRHYCGSDAKRAAEMAKSNVIGSIINT